MEILLTMGLLVISGVGTFFYMQNQDEFDIMSDYKAIKTAYKSFRNENIGLTKGIENLRKYLPSSSKVKLSNYQMSEDDKSLIVKKIPKKVDANVLIKQIGGNSTYKNNKLMLSFFTLGNGVEAEAVIGMKPLANFTTTTKIEYFADDSIVDGNQILEVEWENDEEYFDTEGVHTIKLRVMDKHFRWSEWVSKEIFVAELKGIKSIHASGGHLMVLHNNGKVFGYGENNFGQLGNCTNQNSVLLDEIVQAENIADIAVGDNHTLFLKTDRRVFATGKNDFGQLGNGSRTNSKIPKLAWGIENIVQVAAGRGFSAAVTSDGFVYTWGSNENHCLAISEVHFVDRPLRVEGMENIKAVALGFDFALALGYDGNVKAWGNNSHGQLALGYKGKFSDPLTTQLKDIKMISAGRNFALALSNNGRVYGFGINKNHQIGFDGEKEVLFPFEIPGLRDIEKISCSNDFVVVLDKVGTMYTWGQYSPVDNDYSIRPFECDQLKYVKDIATSQNEGYALDENDDVYQFSTKFQDLIKIEVIANNEG